MATAAKTARVPSNKTLMKGIETPEGFTRDEDVFEDGWGQWKRKITRLTLKNEDGSIRIEVHFYSGQHRGDSYSLGDGHVYFKGANGREFCFDRHGVEDSFYVENPAKEISRERWRLSSGVRVVDNSDRIGTVTKGPGYNGWGDDRKWEGGTTIEWDDGETQTLAESTMKRQKKIKRASAAEQANHTIRQFINERIPAAIAKQAETVSIPEIPFGVTPDKKASVTKLLKEGAGYSFMPSGFGTGYSIGVKRTSRFDTAAPEAAKFFGVKSLYYRTFDAD